MKSPMRRTMMLLVLLLFMTLCLRQTLAFSPISKINSRPTLFTDVQTSKPPRIVLHMSDSGGGGGGGLEKQKDTKGKQSVQLIDKLDTEQEEELKPEDTYRVILHNDEVHTFNYVIQSLQKAIGTLDRKKAFDICVVTHGNGQATIISGLWKKQALKYCVDLQRSGLTASIANDKKFSGFSGDNDA